MSDKIEFKFKKPKDSPGYLLAQINMLWQRKQKKVLDPLNLTHTQFVLLAALAWLSKDSKNVTQVDIANAANADSMMVSKVLRKLEEKKFIARKEHTTDTRAKWVILTEKGAKILQKAIIEVEKADMNFFSPLGSNITDFNLDMQLIIEKNKKI